MLNFNKEKKNINMLDMICNLQKVEMLLIFQRKKKLQKKNHIIWQWWGPILIIVIQLVQ